jgi:hypothetical protein
VRMRRPYYFSFLLSLHPAFRLKRFEFANLP